MIDDMAWTVIEDQELWRKARELVYPKIQKRERLRRENRARETFSRCMKIPEEHIEKFGISGGMTNTNFYVKAEGKEYILRIPGACTDIMIDRKSERHNGALASDCGINVPTLYFDADTGSQGDPVYSRRGNPQWNKAPDWRPISGKPHGSSANCTGRNFRCIRSFRCRGNMKNIKN